METQLRLHFNCPKKFDELIESSNGLYCSDCEKTVMDYSKLTKSEIIREFENYDQAPCAIVPTNVLSNVDKPTIKFWTPYRKSTILLTALLLLGNIKSLLAQGKQKIKDSKQDAFEIPAGFQKVMLSGFIHDNLGKDVTNGKVIISFFGEEIGTGIIGADGKFDCAVENYGGIKEVDIVIKADGFYSKELNGIQILKEKPVIKVGLERDYAIHGNRWGYTMGGAMTMISSEYRMRSSTRQGYFEQNAFGLQFEMYDKWQEPVYTEKLHYPTLVVDEHGNPIPNARVELHFSSLETRWGITDETGNVPMHIHLNKPALHANVVVSADGYHSKRSLFYEFDGTGKHVFTLNKKRESIENVEQQTSTDIDIVPEELSKVDRDSITEQIAVDDHLLLFPNPAIDMVNIQFNGLKNASIQLIDITGKTILRKAVFNQSTVLLEVKEIASGNYVVLIQYDGKSFREKLIIAR